MTKSLGGVPALAGDRVASGSWVYKQGKGDSTVSGEVRIPPDGYCTWLEGPGLPPPLGSRTLCPEGSDVLQTQHVGISVKDKQEGKPSANDPCSSQFYLLAEEGMPVKGLSRSDEPCGGQLDHTAIAY